LSTDPAVSGGRLTAGLATRRPDPSATAAATNLSSLKQFDINHIVVKQK
jgi:hypothetical protein